jgi:hypothetical protein
MDTFQNETNIAAVRKTGPRKDGLIASKLSKKCVLTVRRRNATYLGLLYKSRTQESTC